MLANALLLVCLAMDANSTIMRFDERSGWLLWVAADVARGAQQELTSYHLLRAMTISPASLRESSQLLKQVPGGSYPPDSYEADYPEVRGFLSSLGVTTEALPVTGSTMPLATAADAKRDLECVIEASGDVARADGRVLVEPRDVLAAMPVCHESRAALTLVDLGVTAEKLKALLPPVALTAPPADASRR